MERRPLGRTGLNLSAVGFGAARIALPDRERTSRDPQGREAALNLLEAAYKFGCNHFDTADGYGLGSSESILGAFVNAPGHCQPPCIVTTKVGWNFYNVFVADHVREQVKVRSGIRLDADVQPKESLPFDHGQNFSFQYLDFAVNKSLERLQKNSIDVLLLHVPSVSALRSDDWDSSLRKLRSMGKCLLYGVSVRHPLEAFAALECGKPDVLQVPVGLIMSKPMQEALTLAKGRGVGVIGREILVQGLLPGWLLSTGLRGNLEGSLPASAVIAQTLIEETLKNEFVDCLIVGCSTLEQVRDDFGYFGTEEINPTLRRRIIDHAVGLLVGKSGAVPTLDGGDRLADLDLLEQRSRAIKWEPS